MVEQEGKSWKSEATNWYLYIKHANQKQHKKIINETKRTAICYESLRRMIMTFNKSSWLSNPLNLLIANDMNVFTGDRDVSQ